MLKKLWNRIKNKSQSNQRGSALSVSLIVMVVLAASVSAITQVTVNQMTNTNKKIELVNDESTAKRLIQQAIGEFEAYFDPAFPDRSFDSYESTILTTETRYGIQIDNVTGLVNADVDFSEFGIDGTTETRVYKFSYLLNNGTTLVMYSYVSNVGSTVQTFNPFDFSLGTNGDLVLTSGFYRESAFFAENVYFNDRAPYIEKTFWGTTAEVTPSNYYPDFNAGGNNADVYYTGVYEYCGDLCFDTGGVNDPFVLEKSKFTSIVDSGLETGTYAHDTVISDFFGTFDFEQTVIDFVKDVGPTESRVITDVMTIDNIAEVVEANSGVNTYECGDPYQVWISLGPGRWNGYWSWTQDCWGDETSEPYTDITNDTNFDPLYDDETLDYAAYYNGDLTVREGLHMADRTNETLVINGDLIIDSNWHITLDGKFVILGDLIFQGGTVDIDGAFYVLGQTIFDFDEGYGVVENGNSHEYGLTIMGKDNIIVKSMWESHSSSSLPDQFDAFWYTEESIYIDAVNSRVNYNGVMFANAKGVSGNNIPMVDEDGVPIRGIVVNAYRGYINDWGSAVPNRRTNRNSFYFDVINSVDLQNAFTEIPGFDSLVISEGTYTFERSEFSYE